MAGTAPSSPNNVISASGGPGPVDAPWPAPPAAPTPSPAYPSPAYPSLAPTAPAPPKWSDVAPAGGLLLLSVGVHIAAMFPPYTGNPPVAILSAAYETALYICLAVGWAVAALLVLTRVSVRGGAALGGGLAAVELGFLVTDLAGAVRSSGQVTSGIWLAFAALALGGAGALLGASMVPMGGPRLRPYDRTFHPRAVATVLVALLAVIAFLPSWDKYEVVNAAGGTTTVTLGNVFSQPAAIMAGELLAALAIGVVVVLAAFWAPPVVGSWMTGGALIALSSQLISAAVQVNQSPSVTIGGAQATIALTWWWALDVGAAIALAGLAVWSAIASRQTSAHLQAQPLSFEVGSGGTRIEQ